MRKIPAIIVLCVVMASAITAYADEASVVLKSGEGIEEASANCAVCHSLDYIKMNAPFITADGWKAEVAKMRKVFGATIDDAVAAKIAAYLAAEYGPAG